MSTDTPLLCASRVEGGVHSPDFHPFAAAIHLAFCEHLPLRLEPDHVWAVIVQGFANHVTLSAERLQERLVRFDGRRKLSVRRDDFRAGRENPWHEVVEEFSNQLGEHLGATRDLVVADFSTTGMLERTVSQVLLMDAVSSYFEFETLTLCGIPRVTLGGTPDDWRAVLSRARALRRFDLDEWLDALEPVLQGFVDAAEGRADRQFWASACKYGRASGGPVYSGWVGVLFPYLQHLGHGLSRNPHFGTWRDPLDSHGGPRATEFPHSLARVPVTWRHFSEELALELLGGFVGVTQDPETLEVAPAVGWALRERAPA